MRQTAKWLWPLAICSLLAFATAFAATNAGAAHAKRIIFIHSFGPEFRPWSEHTRAIRAELLRQMPWTVDIQDHSLVGARSNDLDAELTFVEYLRALYSAKPPDLIIAIGAPAAAFVQRHRQNLFPAVPMLFTAVEQRRVQLSELTDNDTVVAVSYDFRYIFESFLRIAPSTRVVAIINGSSPGELYWKGEISRELKPLDERLDIRWYDKMSFEDILKQVAALPPNSAVYWLQMIVDGKGIGHEGDDSLARLYANANAPIFVSDDAFFGKETIGGPMLATADVAQRAANAVMRILNGEKPGDVKISPASFAPPRYDWRQLQRWQIDQSLLPAGSQVLFHQPAAWEQYRWQIALFVTALLLQAALISGLLLERRRRRLAEVQVRQRSLELAHINRYSMAGEFTTTIAHELNQPLGAILTNVETAEFIVRSSQPNLAELGEILADIRRDDQRASEVISRLRGLLKKTPFDPKSIDLNDVARETMLFLSALAVGRGVDLIDQTDEASLPVKGDPILLQQVIVNLLINAMDATVGMPKASRQIVLSSATDGNFADFAVSDAGPGIPPEKLKDVFEPFFTTKAEGIGMGLSIARTIVEAHGGQLIAENNPNGGAIFRIRLPLAHPALDLSSLPG